MSIRIRQTEQNHAPSIDESRKHATSRLQSLMRSLSDKCRAADEVDNLRTLIASMPLASGDFCVVMNRLRNAQRYLLSDEIGAARDDCGPIHNRS